MERPYYRRNFGDYNPKNKIEIDWDHLENQLVETLLNIENNIFDEVILRSTQNPKSMKDEGIK